MTNLKASKLPENSGHPRESGGNVRSGMLVIENKIPRGNYFVAGVSSYSRNWSTVKCHIILNRRGSGQYPLRSEYYMLSLCILWESSVSIGSFCPLGVEEERAITNIVLFLVLMFLQKTRST